ncbi:MAG: conjugal transfer protein TraG N-terminal domain-containing protein [Candidatus Sedimenticola endophacoides]
MAVDSYLELFTTLFGWNFYNINWNALSEVGIVYIPFILIVIRNWIEPAKSPGYRVAWSMSLKGMEIELYTAILVAVFAGSPVLSLQANLMSYTPPATLAVGPQPTATVASPQSTYGSGGAFANPPNAVSVPVWWYVVMTLSKGINHAIIAGFPQTAGIRQVQLQAQLATIPDARLREEAQQFFNDCYLPARSWYLREKPDTAQVTNLLTTFGEDDTEWMGSHVYRTLYYPQLRAERRVQTWPYDPTRDVDYDPAGIYSAGQPYCSQWWEDATLGLRARLSDAAANTSSLENTIVRLAAGLPGFAGVTAMASPVEKARDWAVRKALDNARLESMGVHHPDDFGTYSNREGFLANTLGVLADAAGTAGSTLTLAGTKVMTNVLKPALPMAQALILMAIYAILPFVVVFSQYSLGMLAAGAIGIFTVNFWTVLWKLGEWVDEQLIHAMNASTMDGLFSSGVLDALHATNKVIVLNIMLAVFMLGLPMVWTMLMTWVGIKSFNYTNDVLNSHSGTRAGQESGSTGSQLANKAITKR